jgi:hypothetical protein
MPMDVLWSRERREQRIPNIVNRHATNSPRLLVKGENLDYDRASITTVLETGDLPGR